MARADRDLPGLTVLALLLTGPRHTYEMHRMMIDTHKDFVTGLPRSMYHAVERLLRDQLIRVVGTARNGTRPERTVYELTAAGRGELTARVRRLLEQPDPDATLLVAALSFIGCLPPVEAASAALGPLRRARRPDRRAAARARRGGRRGCRGCCWSRPSSSSPAAPPSGMGGRAGRRHRLRPAGLAGRHRPPGRADRSPTGRPPTA